MTQSISTTETPLDPEQVARSLEVLKAKVATLQAERDFWSEQARSLQNQLQIVMRSKADMLDQMARTSLTSEDVRAHLANVTQELRQPITSVEATMGLIAMHKHGTQGAYTPVNATDKPLIARKKKASK